jgi:TonB family protein
MAAEIQKAKLDSVIVFDFLGPGERLTDLGVSLSRDMTGALSRDSSGFVVMDQTKFDQLFEKKSVRFSAVRDSSTAIWAGREVGAKAVVVGHLLSVDEKLVMELFCFRTADRSPIAGFKVSFPMTSDLRKLSVTQDDGSFQGPYAAVPLAGKNGYSRPACVRYPAAQYDERALREGASGTVKLSVTVGKDSKAHDIAVISALPYGLTEKAVEAVSNWTFKPALGPDGHPAAVRQDVEVMFNLYKKPGSS